MEDNKQHSKGPFDHLNFENMLDERLTVLRSVYREYSLERRAKEKEDLSNKIKHLYSDPERDNYHVLEIAKMEAAAIDLAILCEIEILESEASKKSLSQTK
jgi:hypothetical protein